jgi:hypothetical protein
MALDEKLDARFDEPPCEPAGDARPEDPVSEEEERRLVRKLDRRILPIACLLYLFACQSYTLRPFYSDVPGLHHDNI